MEAEKRLRNVANEDKNLTQMMLVLKLWNFELWKVAVDYYIISQRSTEEGRVPTQHHKTTPYTIKK